MGKPSCVFRHATLLKTGSNYSCTRLYTPCSRPFLPRIVRNSHTLTVDWRARYFVKRIAISAHAPVCTLHDFAFCFRRIAST